MSTGILKVVLCLAMSFILGPARLVCEIEDAPVFQSSRVHVL